MPKYGNEPAAHNRSIMNPGRGVNVRVLRDSTVRKDRRSILVPSCNLIVEGNDRSIANTIVRIQDVKPTAAREVSTIVERAALDCGLDRRHLALAGTRGFGAISKPGVLLAADAPPEEVKEEFAVFYANGHGVPDKTAHCRRCGCRFLGLQNRRRRDYRMKQRPPQAIVRSATKGRVLVLFACSSEGRAGTLQQTSCFGRFVRDI